LSERFRRKESARHTRISESRISTQENKISPSEKKTPENKSNAKKQEKYNNLEKLHRNQWWTKGNAAPVPCEKHHRQCSQAYLKDTHETKAPLLQQRLLPLFFFKIYPKNLGK
jgi:hypothetical protein